MSIDARKIIVILAALPFLVGCRFGNNVVLGTTPDPWTGYYATTPQTSKLCITRLPTAAEIDSSGSTSPVTNCLNADTIDIPQRIKGAMSNPVAVINRAPEDGGALLADNTIHWGIPTSFDEKGNIFFVASSYPDTAWFDDACKTQVFIEERGSVLQKSTGLLFQNKYPILGQIQVSIQYTQTFDGHCDATFSQFLSCYDDPAKCGGASAVDNADRQAAVQAVFGAFIHAGIMTAQDILTIKNIAADVSYQ